MPFTADQFFDVFRVYNQAVWPAQWLLTAAGAACLVAALSRKRIGARLSLLLLAALGLPVLWSFIGATAAFTLGVAQDYLLGLAGLWSVAQASRWI